MQGGHGYINKRENGGRARCGGPAMCKKCQTEQCVTCGLVGTEAAAKHSDPHGFLYDAKRPRTRSAT